MKPPGTLRRSHPMRRVSPKRRAERAAAQPVVDAVMARDCGCLLRHHTHLAGPCAGPLTPHHLRKAWKASGWTVDNLVVLCATHNGWVERESSKAWGLGLVVKNGETTGLAWGAMRNAGLPVGSVAVLRCTGSGESVVAMRVVSGGRTACLACGLRVRVVQHRDGGPGAFLDDHDREVRL